MVESIECLPLRFYPFYSLLIAFCVVHSTTEVTFKKRIFSIPFMLSSFVAINYTIYVFTETLNSVCYLSFKHFRQQCLQCEGKLSWVKSIHSFHLFKRLRGSKSPTNWFSVIVESKQTAMGSLQNSSQHNQFVTNMISLSSLWQLFRRRMLLLSRLCLCLFNGIAFFFGNALIKNETATIVVDVMFHCVVFCLFFFSRCCER